jgi:transketolase
MNASLKMMRDVFIEGLYNRMHEDENLFFVCADFGSPKLDALREKFGDRFINVGIAEQNMINVSTGLALEGYTVYAYAIAPFITMRCYEQIRTNISIYAQLKELNINLVGVGAGLSYDVSGPTHHCLEDISIMRTLPHVEVFSPCDWGTVEKLVDYSIRVKKPKYLRFDSKPVPLIHDNLNDAVLRNGFCEISKGEEVCLISTGFMTHRAMNAANILRKTGIKVGVIDAFSLKNLNESLLMDILRSYRCVITLEEAFVGKGGLDSLITGILNRNKLRIDLINLGIDDHHVFDIGSREYLHKINQLDEESIMKKVKENIKSGSKR